MKANDEWRERNNLVQMNTAVPSDELAKFDAACKKNGVSRRQVLRDLMSAYSAKSVVRVKT